MELIKFTVVILGNRLRWKDRIRSLGSRLATGIHIIRKVKKAAGNRSAKITYYVKFHSVIPYGIMLWGTASIKMSAWSFV